VTSGRTGRLSSVAPLHQEALVTHHSSLIGGPAMLARSCCRIFSTLNFLAAASILSSTWSKSKDVAFEKRPLRLRSSN